MQTSYINNEGQMIVTVDGESHTVLEWADILCIYPVTIRARVKNGLDIRGGKRAKPTICPVCGKSFVKKKSKQVCCSKECGYIHMQVERPKSICKTCGREFTVLRDRDGIYCSRECQHAGMKKDFNYNAREKLEADYRSQCKDIERWMVRVAKNIEYVRVHIRTCEVCGIRFNATSTNTNFCSERCRRRHDNACKDKRIYRNGKPDLSISLTKLYMRDGGICQICGREIDFDCDSNSDYYPSIDHIIPISKGGLHEWSNVQLACRVCNTMKGDKFERK